MRSLKKQSGFTLIELVVVIVILGILAATALPRFVDLTSDARFAAAKGLQGSVASAMNMAYAKALATGVASDASGKKISVDGADIDLVYGYPDKASIASMLKGDTGGTYDAATGVWTIGGKDSCKVTYTAATSAAPATVTTVADASSC